MVPMEELEGRMDGEAHRLLVKSSAAAGIVIHGVSHLRLVDSSHTAFVASNRYEYITSVGRRHLLSFYIL